jgi:hypothetical protein
MTARHRLIRTNGTEQTLENRPSFEEIRALIGCDCLEHVTLSSGSDSPA